MPLYHFDLYRLDDPDQLEDTGIFDVLGADGVCSIEWGEQFADQIGDARRGRLRDAPRLRGHAGRGAPRARSAWSRTTRAARPFSPRCSVAPPLRGPLARPSRPFANCRFLRVAARIWCPRDVKSDSLQKETFFLLRLSLNMISSYQTRGRWDMPARNTVQRQIVADALRALANPSHRRRGLRGRSRGASQRGGGRPSIVRWEGSPTRAPSAACASTTGPTALTTRRLRTTTCAACGAGGWTTSSWRPSWRASTRLPRRRRSTGSWGTRCSSTASAPRARRPRRTTRHQRRRPCA